MAKIQADIDINIRDFISGLEHAAKNVADFQKKVSQTHFNITDPAEFKKTQTALSTLAKQFDKTQDNIGKNLKEQKQALAALVIAGKEGTKEFKALERQMLETAKNSQKINAAFDKIEAKAKKSGGDAGKKFSSEFKQRLKSIGDVAIGNILAQGLSGAANLGRQAAQSFVELDKQIQNLGTLGVKNFKDFTGEALKLSKELPDSAANIAEGFYQAVSAGLDPAKDDLVGFTKIASKAAAAGLSDTKSAVDGLTSVINAYGLSTDAAQGISDTFFAGIKLGKTTFEEINASIAQFVPSAAAMGVSFEQGTAAIASLTAQGTPTALAATQMNAAFTLLSKGTAPLNKALAGIGTDLDTLRGDLAKPVEEGGGLVNVLGKIKEAADKAGVEVAALTGRVEAAKLVEQLAGTDEKLKKSLDTYKRVQEEIAAGASTQAFDIAAQGLDVQLKVLKNNLLAAIGELFKGIAPLLQTLTENITRVLGDEKVIGAFQSLGKNLGDIFSKLAPVIIDILASVLQMAAQLADALNPIFDALIDVMPVILDVAKTAFDPLLQIITDLAPVITSVIKTIAGLLNAIAPLSPAILGAVAGFKAFSLAIAANPIGLAVTGVVGLIAVLDALITTEGEAAEAAIKAAEAESKVNEERLKAANAKVAAINANKELVNEYESLVNTSNRTAEEEKKLTELTHELARAYPGAITGTNNLKENLVNLKERVLESNNELEGLSETISKLERNQVDIDIRKAEAKIDKLVNDFKESNTGKLNFGLFTVGADSDFYEGFDALIEGLAKANDPKKIDKIFNKAKLAIEQNTDITDDAYRNKLLLNVEQIYSEKLAIIDKNEKKTRMVVSQELGDLVKEYTDKYGAVGDIVSTALKTGAQDDSAEKLKAKIQSVYKDLKKGGLDSATAINEIAAQLNITEQEAKKLLGRTNLLGSSQEAFAKVIETATKALKRSEEQMKAFDKAAREFYNTISGGAIDDFSKAIGDAFKNFKKKTDETLPPAGEKFVSQFDKAKESVEEFYTSVTNFSKNVQLGIEENELKAVENQLKAQNEAILSSNALFEQDKLVLVKENLDKILDLQKDFEIKKLDQQEALEKAQIEKERDDKIKALEEQRDEEIKAAKKAGQGTAKLKKKFNALIYDVETASALKLQALEDKFRDDRAKKEQDLTDKTNQDKLKQEQDTQQKITDIQEKELQKRNDAQQAFIDKWADYYEHVQGFIDGLNQQVNAKEVKRVKEAYKEKEDSLKNERKELEKLVRDGSITYNEYVDKLNDLDKERADLQKQKRDELKDATFSWVKAIQDATNKLNQQVNKNIEKLFSESYYKIFEVSSDIETGIEQLKVNWENTLDVMGKAAGMAAISIAGSFGTMLAEGGHDFEDYKNAFLIQLIDMIQIAINALAAQIFAQGAAAAPFGLGVPGSLALIATTNALLAAAKAGLQGAQEGMDVVTKNGQSKPGSKDTIPFMLAEREAVINAAAAEKNRELISWMNRTRRPAEEFLLSKLSVNSKGALEYAKSFKETPQLRPDGAISIRPKRDKQLDEIAKGINRLDKSFRTKFESKQGVEIEMEPMKAKGTDFESTMKKIRKKAIKRFA